jgi:hypothetical protein
MQVLLQTEELVSWQQKCDFCLPYKWKTLQASFIYHIASYPAYPCGIHTRPVLEECLFSEWSTAITSSAKIVTVLAAFLYSVAYSASTVLNLHGLCKGNAGQDHWCLPTNQSVLCLQPVCLTATRWLHCRQACSSEVECMLSMLEALVQAPTPQTKKIASLPLAIFIFNFVQPWLLVAHLFGMSWGEWKCPWSLSVYAKCLRSSIYEIELWDDLVTFLHRILFFFLKGWLTNKLSITWLLADGF